MILNFIYTFNVFIHKKYSINDICQTLLCAILGKTDSTLVFIEVKAIREDTAGESLWSVEGAIAMRPRRKLLLSRATCAVPPALGFHSLGVSYLEKYMNHLQFLLCHMVINFKR